MAHCYVLKKQLIPGEEMDQWTNFLLLFPASGYNILSFKKQEDGKKLRIRFYFNTFEFQYEKKTITNLNYGFIPYQWHLKREIKTVLPIKNFSKVMDKSMIESYKFRSAYNLSNTMKCTLDLPSNTLEIKSSSLSNLYHFILENNKLFCCNQDCKKMDSIHYE
jgi:hypothetical protein